MKYKITIEKPTDASPETKEQFVLHALLKLYQGVKGFTPPKSKISPGLTLPQKFLRIKFINNNTTNI